MKRISAVFVVCAGLLAAGGCNSSSPTTPTTSTGGGVTSITQVLSGTMAPGDTPFHSFTLPGTQPLHIMFGSLTDASTGVPLGSTVTLRFGIEPTAALGTCDPLVSLPVTAALKAQINMTVSTGAYCVSVTDTSGVPVSANYAIRIIYGTPSDADSSGTISYASTVVPGGYTARNFGVAVAGVATITLDSFSPASVATLGLGLGFQRNDGSGCEVATAIIATRGRELSVPVDAGLLCVKVFDPGTLTGTANFALRILHP